MQNSDTSDDDRESLLPTKSASIHQPRIVGRNESLELAVANKRKPYFIAAKIHEEDEEAEDRVDNLIRASDNHKLLIMNQSKSNRIAKFPCTIGEANELLMRQLVTVKFSFNSLSRNEKTNGEPKVDYNGNYDVLPLISPEDLKATSINSNCSNVSDDRQTTIERQLELNEMDEEHENRISKQDQFDKSVQILYQKFEQRSRSDVHPLVGTMIVHQFITVAELSPSKGCGKLCQLCHRPLLNYSTIKCVHCDFKCHTHCQNKVSGG